VESRALFGDRRLTIAAFDLEELTSAHQRAVGEVGFIPSG
jgi:hypothetical protein